MPSISTNIHFYRAQLPSSVSLLAVSKFHPVEAIMEAYRAGQRDFGESRVQELLCKYPLLPQDIHWHFIGHLQTNKVRSLLPCVSVIQSVDSMRLLDCIEQEAARIHKQVAVLLEVHVARDETKSGFTPTELAQVIDLDWTQRFPHLELQGLMGMATLTDDQMEWRRCFKQLKQLWEQCVLRFPQATTLSMGMSDDYTVAIQEGSTQVRIGSSIFGERQ